MVYIKIFQRFKGLKHKMFKSQNPDKNKQNSSLWSLRKIKFKEVSS